MVQEIKNFLNKQLGANGKRQSLLFASFFLLCLPLFAQQVRHFELPVNISEDDYASDIVVVKVRNTAQTPNTRTLQGSASSTIQKIQQLPSVLGARPVAKESPATVNSRSRNTTSSLDGIYILEVSGRKQIVPLINQLLKQEEVVYAEPYYLMKPLGEQKVMVDGYVPSDPAATPGGKQSYLSVIRAYEAWAIEKGNPDVLIGLLDTGIGLGHQDLMGNLRYNQADPVNGKDDDGDGYTDNYLGWDMADNDNDPTADRDAHGTRVAGILAATTDNGIGVAGAGFRSSFMPVKIFSSVNGFFYRGYEAIAYAADHGCNVINLSWGAVNSYSAFGQDIIDYAVLEKDAVIVAAAGNGGKFENYYPASYDHVLSVAISDNQDNMITSTSHGYYVDLMAPGNNLYTTDNGDKYYTGSGSSLSSPLVAGTAALIRSKYPDLNALQVMEKLRLGTDDVSAVGTNGQYEEMLGYGRLNMKKALTASTIPAIRMSEMAYTNPTGAYAFASDTLTISLTLQNYLSDATSLTVNLSSPSEYVTLIDSVFNIGKMDSLSSRQLSFKVALSSSLPVNELMYFRLGFSDLGYRDYQYFHINSSPDYLVVSNGTMEVPVGSQGTIAQNPSNYLSTNDLLFGNESLAGSMGLMIGTDTGHVSDNIIENLITGDKSSDFIKEQRIQVSRTDQEKVLTYSSFSDIVADNPMNIRIEQQWITDTLYENFLIAEYRAIPLADSLAQDLYLGLFADWDLGDWEKNKADWDESHQLGYAYDGTTYAGIALLSDKPVTHHAIDWKGLNGNAAEIANEFNDQTRFQFLSAGSKLKAGTQGSGNDVAYVVGGNGGSLTQYESATFAFAIVAGKSLQELQQAVQEAKMVYAEFLSKPLVQCTTYVCLNQPAVVTPSSGGSFRFYQDPLGKNFLGDGESFTTDPITHNSLLYYTTTDEGYESKIYAAKIVVEEPLAKFQYVYAQDTIPGDTILVDRDMVYSTIFNNLSEESVRWQWDFGNGFSSTLRNPVVRFDPGNYEVKLKAYNNAGCADSLIKKLTVLRRSPKPVVPHMTLCAGSQAILSAVNATNLRFYADLELTDLIFQGSALTTERLWNDTSFYVVSVDSLYESLPYQVDMTIIGQQLGIEYQLDTLNLSPKYGITLTAEGNTESTLNLEWYVDDEKVGIGQRILLDYGKYYGVKDQIEVQLRYSVIKNGVFCKKEVSQTIPLSNHSTEATGYQFDYNCQTRAASITAEQNQILYFYSSVNMDSVIHKGSHLSIDSFSFEKQYYVAPVTNFVEGMAVAVMTQPAQLADFTLSADTVYLEDYAEVQLNAFLSDQYQDSKVNWQWDMGNGKFISRPSSFTFQYDSADTYQIRLKAQTADGCEYLVERTLVVLSVMHTVDLLPNSHLKIFPIPTNGTLNISGLAHPSGYANIGVYQLDGRKLYQGTHFYQNRQLQLNLAYFLKGSEIQWLMIRMETGGSITHKRVLYSPFP